ncbi:CorA-like Mg2+ transporter protein [Lentzea albidocapillata subsp. violacea]|uniref:CorA-like Mg2+ transporter protein n=2 Tax=Lentzea albidocapillata TaxID=40571 RepID=A0A1G9XWS7_9PSEU|nr:CorA-like Mg2+ transporter protein [Lentzea albidocapillata subsp. violacea]
MTSLDVKQNQIVKVFTIITAVFLSPTLIATFYGMNFTVMPALAWEHGFLVTTVFTFIAALIPCGTSRAGCTDQFIHCGP